MSNYKPLSVEEEIDEILCIFASDISGKDNDKDYVYFKANKKLQEFINHQTKLARIDELSNAVDWFENESGNLFYLDDRIKQLQGEIE